MAFLERYRQFARKVTDAPYIFHDILAYGVLGVAAGNRWKMRDFTMGWLTPHLWILLLAESSTFHKSSALRVARRCLSRLGDRMLAWEGSHKALMEQFEGHDQGVMMAFEFEQFLGFTRQNYAQGVRALFLDLYDGELPSSVYKQTGTHQGKEQLAISFFTASTPSQLADWLKERDVSAGLLPRFTLVHATEQEHQFSLPPADDGTLERELDGLRNTLSAVSGMSGIMDLTPGARKLYDSWYKRMTHIQLDSTRADPWKSRLATVALKVAMLNQIDKDQTTKIHEKSVADACQFTDTLLRHVAHICQDELALSHFEEQSKRLKYVLKKYASFGQDGWLEWSFILPHMKMQADQLRKLVQTLSEGQQIEWQSKRPQKLRLPIREPGEDDR